MLSDIFIVVKKLSEAAGLLLSCCKCVW